MIRFVTYSADNMTTSKEVCCRSAQAQGADVVYPHNPHMISHEFRQNNRATLAAEKGAGYWLWKPYVINEAVHHCEDGDILIYGDAGVEFIAPFQHIIDVMDQDIFLFSNGHKHGEWCKMDCIEAIIGTSTHEIGISVEHQQVQASVIFFRVNTFTRNFIKEWLLWCQMPGMIDDTPSKVPNVPTFAEHRYDQAILTCLQIKYGISLHWWADKMWYESQRYRWPLDTYPSMFLHHRKRNRGTNDGNPEW